jgi:uncharacterized repeat protein (TIGR03843 family)
MSENENDKSSSVAISIERVLEVLEKGAIEQEYGVLRWSSNYAFLIGITHEDTEITAVYKPQRGERPLWDFPDGTLCYRELASFLTSQELGWDIVPPTALREGSRGLGTMQFFIDHDPQVNYFSFNENMDEAIEAQLKRIVAFDYIVNNADRKGGHCLLDSQGHLWGIDHGITFHVSNKLRTVIWDFAGEPVPAPLLEALEQLNATLENAGSTYRGELCDLLTGAEISAFQSRVRHLLKTRRYPLPGPGPNYPWPPV